ncbi:MAG: 30S ribosomal protein S12 methylthiotransferase RimO [Bacillota bacterium]
MIFVCALSLGCAKNRVDTEVMLGLLGTAGYGVTSDPQAADVILVNTCAFIAAAQRESIITLLEATGYKQEGRLRALIAAGCLAERHGAALLREIPEIDAVLGTGKLDRVVEVVEGALEGRKPVVTGDPGFLHSTEPRLLTTPSYTAYIKIAEGCGNRCSFCVIPALRGRFRSRSREDIVTEAGLLAAGGVKELILVAQDTTKWGTDLYGRPGLPGLLQELAHLDGVRWIRLLYAYPTGISEELLRVMAEEERICRYLDIPLQHVSPHLLKSMNRPVTDAKELVRKVRAAVPGVALRTTFIVGFPGETETDFTALKEAVRELKFEHVGVFAYSREDGTPAAAMSGRVSGKVREKRARDLKKVTRELSFSRNQSRVGQEIPVLAEGKQGRFFRGRSESDAPDVDGTVCFDAVRPVEPGDFVKVRVTAAKAYDLIGEAVQLQDPTQNGREN